MSSCVNHLFTEQTFKSKNMPNSVMLPTLNGFQHSSDFISKHQYLLLQLPIFF